MKISVGSDFSGVGAFNQALIRLDINYDEIFACDMDKYARQTFIANYGKPKYYPENVYDREVPNKSLDIYMTSPPCQAFSLAGKRKGENDDRGILFYNSHEFIQKNKPRYFIFENVKGLISDNKGKTFQNWIDLLAGKTVNGNPVMFPHPDSTPYHIYYKVLNAKHYGVPQNRERVFIVGIRNDADNTFRWPKPEKLNKTLKDILENEVDEKYYLSDKMIEYLHHRNENTTFGKGKLKYKTENDTANCLTKSSSSLDISDNIIKIKSATKKGYEVATENDSINLSQPNSETRRGRVGKKVAQTLDTSCNQGVLIGAYRGRNPQNPNSRKKGDYYEQTLEINKENISNTLSTVQKDNLVVKYDTGKNSQGYRVYDINGIACNQNSQSGGAGAKTGLYEVENYKIRRLTPRECFRLMDFPDSFNISQVSNTQAYKQAGNSIVVNVLAKIIEKFNL